LLEPCTFPCRKVFWHAPVQLRQVILRTSTPSGNRSSVDECLHMPCSAHACMHACMHAFWANLQHINS
jgi:hypothetical protein